MTKTGNGISILLLFAVLLGLAMGTYFPANGQKLLPFTEPLVVTLLLLLFFELPLKPLHKASLNRNFILLAWVANFILIPLIGWGIASFIFGDQPMIFVGLLLYFLFPCTDWFLAFTRIAKGDTVLGSVLIPINLISQLLLFPLYLTILVGSKTVFDLDGMWGTLVGWFLFPLFGALFLRILLTRFLPTGFFDSITSFAGYLVPWVLSALVFCIFSSNTHQLTAYSAEVPQILFAVFLFFLSSWFMGELLARYFRLTHPQYVLLAMTTAARNSPLILGLATIALPDQPLVYAALIIGMLLEFPHLTVLSRILQQQISRISSLQRNQASNM